MILVLIATLLSALMIKFVSGGNEERYVQTRDILGWKVEEGDTFFHKSSNYSTLLAS